MELDQLREWLANLLLAASNDIGEARLRGDQAAEHDLLIVRQVLVRIIAFIDSGAS